MIYQLAVLLLIFASAQGQCTYALFNNSIFAPTVALAFDFGAGTALAANRQTFLNSLADNVLSKILSDTNGNTMNFVNGFGSANLASTVGTPATGVIGCQTPPLAIASEYSCAPSIDTDIYQPSIDCMNNLPMTSGASDIISALARVRNAGTACNGLLNSCNNNVYVPCTVACQQTPQTKSNLLVIFWSSPLSQTDINNAEKWLNTYILPKWVNVLVVPIMSTNLIGANATDWTTIQKNVTVGARFIVQKQFNQTDEITNTFDPPSLTKTMTDIGTNILKLAIDATACNTAPANAGDALCGTATKNYCTKNGGLDDQTGVCTLTSAD